MCYVQMHGPNRLVQVFATGEARNCLRTCKEVASQCKAARIGASGVNICTRHCVEHWRAVMCQLVQQVIECKLAVSYPSVGYALHIAVPCSAISCTRSVASCALCR
jgi:hypothetical protein